MGTRLRATKRQGEPTVDCNLIIHGCSPLATLYMNPRARASASAFTITSPTIQRRQGSAGLGQRDPSNSSRTWRNAAAV
jgi:hypothetical protein